MDTYLILFVFSPIGISFNIVSLLIFTLLLKQKKHSTVDLFKYYWLKLIFDCYLSLMNFTRIFFIYFNLPIGQTYGYQVFQIVFTVYLVFCFSMLSISIESAATFNLYRKLTQSFRILDKIPIYLILLIFTVPTCLFYIYKFFEREILEKTDFNTTNNKSVFEVQYSSFRLTTHGKVFRILNSSIRDGFFVCFIIFINVLIIIKLRNLIGFHKKANRELANKKTSANIRIAFMVILSSILVAISHVFLFLEYILNLSALEQRGTKITEFVILFLNYFVSPFCTFFIFFFFNKAFSKKSKRMFICFKTLF